MATIHHTLGRILAIVDHASGGLPATAVTNCLTRPKTALLGQQAINAKPSISARQWLNERMAAACDEINMSEYDALKEPVPPVAQGDMLLAYHRERAELARIAAEHKPTGAGRPSTVDWSLVDWSLVDWSQADADIARQVGVSRQAVQAARKRHAPKAPKA